MSRGLGDVYKRQVGIIQFLNELKVRDTVLTPHQKRLIDEYKARIAAENNNCNTNTAAAAPVLERNCNTNSASASIPGDVNCNTNRASASIPGDVNCNTNYVPAGDDWVTKGL